MIDEAHYGDVIMHRNYDTGEVDVIHAAPVSLLALEILVASDPGALRANGDQLIIGSPRTAVEYRVVGWEPYKRALVIERVDRVARGA